MNVLLTMPGLTGVERQVAGLLLSHMNGATGRCDPGVDRLALMARLDERSVKRATASLSSGPNPLFDKYSHGGSSHRASYAPRWETFRMLAKGKSDMMNLKTPDLKGTIESPLTGHLSPLEGDRNVPLTLYINFPHELSSTDSERGTCGTEGRKRPGGKEPRADSQSKTRRAREEELKQFKVVQRSPEGRRKSPEAKAAQRWHETLAAGLDQTTYAAVVEWMTAEVADEATAAERQKFGYGVAYVRKKLFDEGRHDLAAAIGACMDHAQRPPPNSHERKHDGEAA